MRIFITLDYEVFFGAASTDVDQSIIYPTQKFLDVLNKHNLKAIFFVDAGYLCALKRQREQYPLLGIKYNKITRQLAQLDREGHEIGLHVHPHWEDCRFNGNKWNMDLSRYKLADFTKPEAESIFKKYHAELQSCFSKPIISYRAGGWCLEPFKNFRDAMRECGIYIDSTVYEDGYYHSPTHSFDFRQYPKKDLWRFETDPSKENPEGFFLEVPMSAHDLPPSMYWKVLKNKLLKRTSVNAEGGQPVKPTVGAVLRKLFLKTRDAVSIDSFKSDLLLKSFRKFENDGQDFCCLIGHPKCFTAKTYKNLDVFIEYAIEKGHTIATYLETFGRLEQKEGNWVKARKALLFSKETTKKKTYLP